VKHSVLLLLLTACSGDFSHGHTTRDAALPLVAPQESGATRVAYDGGSHVLQTPLDGGTLPTLDAVLPDAGTEGSRPTSEDSGAPPEASVTPDGAVTDATNQPEHRPDAKPAYCVDCQPMFGRPPCCTAYHTCGYINGLNTCTNPKP